MDEITEWLTTQEAADVLEITRGYVQQLHRRGKFPHARKIGNNLFIPPSDIEAFKKEKEVAAERRISYHSVADQYKAQFLSLQEGAYKALKILDKMLDDGFENAEPEALRESAEAARDELKKALNGKPCNAKEE